MNNEFINEYDVNNDDNNDDMNNNSSNNNSNENENKKNENDPTNILSFIRSLPVYRGKLPIGCSRRHLTYHVGISYSHKSDRKTLIELALRTSRIACIAADISRGRPISSAMAQLLTPNCITKLDNMWKLMDEYFTDKKDYKAKSELRKMPAIPEFVNGMLISPKHFEGVVHIYAGSVNYWAAIALELINNRWVCTYADLG